MKIRYPILMASALLALAPAAFAGEDAGKNCAALQSQYDKEAAISKTDKIGEAQSLRDEGAKLCSSGKADEGATKLKEAILLLQGSATAPAAPTS